MRVIVIGGTGTIGAAVVTLLSTRHDVVTVGHKRGAFQVDLASPDSITQLFKAVGTCDAVVSTAGIAKMIRKLADDGFRSNLALSLHAADDVKRNEIMPINESNNLNALMEALEYFYRKTHNRISYEYIAFQNFNDSLDDAARLVRLCRRKFPVRVNIIEYNPVGGVSFEKSDENRLNLFAAYLAKEGVTVTVRRSRGKDIDAACGQLANKE